MPSSEGVLEVKNSVSECGTPSRRFRTIIEVCQKLLQRVADDPSLLISMERLIWDGGNSIPGCRCTRSLWAS